MQILINGSFWAEPNVGSGQYLHGLLRWLTRIAPQHRYMLIRPAYSEPGPPLPDGVAGIGVRTPFDQINRNLAKVYFEQWAFPRVAARLARHLGPAVLFVPYFAPPLRSQLPFVTTVGDIIPLLLPEYRGGRHVQAYMRLVTRTVHGSAAVLTFSQRSRIDILARLKLPSEKVTAVLLAAGDQYTPGDGDQAQAEVAQRYGLNGKFIYYVGGLDARKNVATLVRAFGLLRSRGSQITLAIAGRALGRNSQLFPDLDAQIAELGLDGTVRRIDVPLEDGPLLYRACTIFAFPSRYEGFGLPPLEAMACGAPVVVSDASSLPEVVGSAALRVPPDDVVAWVTALSRLIKDNGLREDLRRRGLAQAARFSYRLVAEETLAVLERAAR
ncbi:MAG: glycosyltransferase family 4 protein [Oscillochloris sp.]|nr:glycosyltransferase family 4 protein [Oscillochloris sp.]